jgi:hypothetical protein
MLHARPSQRSASVTPAPESLTKVPTAIQAEAAEHDTENSWPFDAKGFGLETTDQPPSAALAAVASEPITSIALATATAPLTQTAARKNRNPRRVKSPSSVSSLR